MGQKVSIEQEEENELFNIFQLYAQQKIQPVSKVIPTLSFRILPTILATETTQQSAITG